MDEQGCIFKRLGAGGGMLLAKSVYIIDFACKVDEMCCTPLDKFRTIGIIDAYYTMLLEYLQASACKYSKKISQREGNV